MVSVFCQMPCMTQEMEEERLMTKIDIKKENFAEVHTEAHYEEDGTVEVIKIDKLLPDENTYLRTKEIEFRQR